MKDFYAYIHGKTIGPCSLEELKELDITSQTLIGTKNADGDFTFKEAGQIEKLNHFFVNPSPPVRKKNIKDSIAKTYKPNRESKQEVKPEPILDTEQVIEESVTDYNSKSWKYTNTLLIAIIVFLVALVIYWKREKIFQLEESTIATTQTNILPREQNSDNLSNEEKQKGSNSDKKDPEIILPPPTEKSDNQKKYNELTLQMDEKFRSGDFSTAYKIASQASIIRREQSTGIKISDKAQKLYKDLTNDAKNILAATGVRFKSV